MGLWTDRMLPRFIDKMLNTKPVGALRREALTGIGGEVVEIGFGSGLNVALYPPEVTHVIAVEPSTVARQLAAKRIAASTVPVEFEGLDGESLPLPDESVDAAVSTFTLCTIPDVGAALHELMRVLRPGGHFHFLEHGLADDPKTVARQHRFNGLQRRVAGGCNLDRPIEDLVRAAGFEIDHVRNDHMPGPRFARAWGHLYIGVATKPG